MNPNCAVIGLLEAAGGEIIGRLRQISTPNTTMLIPAVGRPVALDVLDRPGTLAVLWSGVVGPYAAHALPVRIARWFLLGPGRAETETDGGLPAMRPGLPVDGVEYLEDEARRSQRKWT
jgi:hypothetical protein